MIKSELIISLDKLIELSNNRKAVIFNGTPPKAAAFFIGIPLRVVYSYIKNKMLYTYEKENV
jgi:hypothetical protein